MQRWQQLIPQAVLSAWIKNVCAPCYLTPAALTPSSLTYAVLQSAGEAADTYIIINATSVELLNVREYVNRMATPGELCFFSLSFQMCVVLLHITSGLRCSALNSKRVRRHLSFSLSLSLSLSFVKMPALSKRLTRLSLTENKKAAVLWNLELETLRGDLGLLGYPQKEVQLQVGSEWCQAWTCRSRTLMHTSDHNSLLFRICFKNCQFILTCLHPSVLPLTPVPLPIPTCVLPADA